MKYSARSSLTKTNRIKYLYLAGFLCFAVAAAAGLMLGSTRLTFSEILRAFTEGFDVSAGTRIFAYVRLPRTVAALVCGAALAVSGAVIQGVLANQLASPSVIGVNAGAGVAVTLCTALDIYGGWRLSLFSFVGAFAAVMLVIGLGLSSGISIGNVTVSGTAIAAVLGVILAKVLPQEDRESTKAAKQ